VAQGEKSAVKFLSLRALTDIVGWRINRYAFDRDLANPISGEDDMGRWVMAVEVRIWSVFNRDERLVLALSDEPGEFNFTRLPDEEADIVECPFATLQCYDVKAESELLNLMYASGGVDDLLNRLVETGYRVVEGRPRVGRIARL
jgi:hypothetical protein